jgi:hypothetical protein
MPVFPEKILSSSIPRIFRYRSFYRANHNSELILAIRCYVAHELEFQLKFLFIPENILVSEKYMQYKKAAKVAFLLPRLCPSEVSEGLLPAI